MDVSYISNSIARKTGNLALAMMTVAISASALPASAAMITTGFTLNFDAGLDTDGDNVWENTEAVQTHNWQLGDQVSLNSSPITGFSGITGAYEFPASGSNLPENKAIAPSYQGLPGNPTNDSASFEIWFRPESLTNGNQVLWETGGGGSGSSFTILDGNTLRFTMKNGSRNMVIETLISQTSEFIQAVATYDRNNPNPTDTLSLYLNGGLVGTETNNNVNDWAGGNGSGLGGRSITGQTGGSGAGGVDLNFGTFEGDIAIFRFYESALSESQVKQNFNAIAEIPETSSNLSLLALASLGGSSIFLRKKKKLREATGNSGK